MDKRTPRGLKVAGIALLLFMRLMACTDAADDTVTIAGVCLDKEGKPVSGATVKLFWLYRSSYGLEKTKLLGQVETSENGTFRFGQLRPLVVGHENDWSEYFLIVTHPQFASAQIRPVNSHQSGDDHENLKVGMEPSGVLSGVVTDTEGNPVAGATVYRPTVARGMLVEIWHDVTDEQGRYKISDLPIWNGDDTVRSNGRATTGRIRHVFYVSHPDYGQKLGMFGETPATVDFQLAPAGFIEGIVMDTVVGEPAAGVTVQAQGIADHGFAQAETDAQGHYRLCSLVADRYNVWAKMPERTVVAIPALAVAAGKTITAPDLKLISGGFITGRVLHFETKEPVSRSPEGWRLTVALQGPARPSPGAGVESVAVSKDGTYRVRAAPGVSHVYLQYPSIVKGQSRRSPIVVQEGDTIELDFYVDPQAKANR